MKELMGSLFKIRQALFLFQTVLCFCVLVDKENYGLYNYFSFFGVYLMRISIPEVKHAKGEAVEYRFDQDLLVYCNDFPQGGNLSLTIKASYSSNQVFIAGSLEAVTKCECSRCLDSFKCIIKTDFSDTFEIIRGLDDDDESNNLSLEAANYLTIKGDYLYLEEYIRQLIILAQDYSPVCDPNCKGLCPECGVNLNKSSCQCDIDDQKVDLRLIKLKDFSTGS